MIPLLEQLTASDLRALTSALKARRLSPPFSRASLGRYLGDVAAGAACVDLSRLSDEGMSLSHTALPLDVLASERERGAG